MFSGGHSILPLETNMRRQTTAIIVAIFLAASALLTFSVNANAAQSDKITICHATNSETNPYVQITVSENSTALAGHEGHTGSIWTPGDKAADVTWGDIIPTEPDVVGLNDTATGRAWLANGCKAPASPPPSTPTPTPRPASTPKTVVPPIVHTATPVAPMPDTGAGIPLVPGILLMLGGAALVVRRKDSSL